MILTKEKGKRMWGSGFGAGGSGGGGGLDPSALAGYATEMWVEEGYISKAFWTELFVIHGTETVYTSDDDGATWTRDGDPTSIIFSPNEIPSEVIVDGETAGTKTKTVRAITSIEAKKGVWTDFYMSALGQNPDGGGGGGSSTLQGLLDVNIPATMTQANDGQVLMYNHQQNRWINANVVTSVAAGTGLATNVYGSGAITSIGTISISATYQTYIGHGETAYGWGNHAQAGYLTSVAFSDLTTHPTTLSGYGITDVKFGTAGTDYVPITLGSTTKNVLTAHQSLSAYATQTWVGQNYLSLSGGTMSNTNLVTNMNADRLDGFHANDMLVHYELSRNSTGSNYWHKLGEYETGGDSSNLIIEIYSGAGYNGLGLQNTWAKIIIKDGWQEMQSAINSVGVSVEQFGYYGYGDLKVIVVATAHNKGAVWVQLPWQYAVGDYVVYGRYTSWMHNDSIDSDTTTAPTSNQEPVCYYRNLSYLNIEGQEAVTIPHDLSVREGTDGATVRIGNMLLSYDSTNKALKIEHQGSNGVEAGNIYATGGVSAIGQNSGGGGGGATTLAGLADVSMSSPSNGQILQYDGNGHWINANPPQTGVTSVAAGTGLATNVSGSGAITSIGTISISATYQTYIGHGETAYGWGNHAQAGYLTSVAFSDLTTHPTTLSGYGITDVKFGTAGTDYVPITLGSTTKNVLTAHQSLLAYATQTWVGQNYLGINGTAAAATKLATARTLWGQSFDGQANVSGTMTDVGEIHFSNNSTRIIDSSGIPGFGWGQIPTSNSSWGVYNHYANGYALYIKTDGCVGIGTTTPGCKLDVNGDGRFLNMLYVRSSGTTEGGEISLQGGTGYNDIEIDNYSGYLRMFRSGGGNCEFQFNPDSRLVHINGGNGSTLRIGDGMLVWDSTNNALKVIKADGTAGNFYATGAVSALGANTSGGGGSSGIYENLTVSETLSFVKSGYTSRIYGDGYGYLHIDGSEYIVMGNDVNMDGYSIYNANDIHADRFYVGTNRYIYLDGNNVLKYYDNGTVRTINFT